MNMMQFCELQCNEKNIKIDWNECAQSAEHENKYDLTMYAKSRN